MSVETPITIKKVCMMIPLDKPNMNLMAFPSPSDKAVTITNRISGPGVNARTTDAIINDKTSANDKLFFYSVNIFTEQFP